MSPIFFISVFPMLIYQWHFIFLHNGTLAAPLFDKMKTRIKARNDISNKNIKNIIQHTYTQLHRWEWKINDDQMTRFKHIHSIALHNHWKYISKFSLKYTLLIWMRVLLNAFLEFAFTTSINSRRTRFYSNPFNFSM